jgi:hypothetical protein
LFSSLQKLLKTIAYISLWELSHLSHSALLLSLWQFFRGNYSLHSFMCHWWKELHTLHCSTASSFSSLSQKFIW